MGGMEWIGRKEMEWNEREGGREGVDESEVLVLVEEGGEVIGGGERRAISPLLLW